MALRLMKRPAFLIGFLFLAGLFFASLLYSWIFNDAISKPELVKNEQGQLIAPPYSPIEYSPFGTDNFGRNLLHVILAGAKYTIGLTIIITTLRILPSLLLAIFNYFYLGRILRLVKNGLDAFNYFPVTLLAYLLLNGIFIWGPRLNFAGVFSYSVADMVYIYIAVLVLIGIPPLALLLTNEIEKIMSYEFIDSARVLGASKKHFIWKHVKPFLLPQVMIVYLREFISILLLVAHLGLLEIFIGGGVRREDLFGNKEFMSSTNEWAGLIGTSWNFVMTTHPWIAVIPVLFITLTILAAKMILAGLMKEVSSDKRK